jgi:hypothetical protein
VTARLGDEDFAWLDRLRRQHYPPERNQVPAHLTLFHQIPPSAEGELDRRLRAAAARPRPRARIAGILDLGGGTAFRVVSEELEAVREALASALHGLLGPQDRAPWRGHVTIQNKVEPREARRLQAELRAGFEPRPLSVTGMTSWRYLGGPWEKVRDFAFRG